MKHLAMLAVLVILAAPLAASRADDKDKIGESPYYPLKVGNTWTYSGPMNIAVVNKVVAHEKIGGVMCAKIETEVNGKVQGSEHIAVTKDGICRYTLNGKEADKPILILKLPAKAGDEWKIDSKIGTDAITGTLKTGEEKITVPAGKYDAMSAGGKIESGNQSVLVTNYFVKDVGVAKIKMEIGGNTIEIDLTKFEPGK